MAAAARESIVTFVDVAVGSPLHAAISTTPAINVAVCLMSSSRVVGYCLLRA
jgi:hypothetical protein